MRFFLTVVAMFAFAIDGTAAVQARRDSDRKARSGTAQEQEFKSRLLGSERQPTSRNRRSLSSGLSDLSGGQYSSSQLSGVAGELAAGLRGTKLDEEKAGRISSSFRAMFDKSAGNDLASARNEMQQSLTQAGVPSENVSRIQQEIETLLGGARRMSDQQEKNVDKLAADLAQIRSGSNVTEEQIQALARDLMAMADGANRPSPESVDKLAQDLANALADGEISRREQIQLAQALEDVLTSANVPPEEFAAVLEDVESILAASGVTRSEIAVIRADLEAIYAELRRHLP